MSLLFVVSLMFQEVIGIMPQIAYAQEGQLTVVSSDVDPWGYFRMESNLGTSVYCVSPGLRHPVGESFYRWDYMGEAQGVEWEPHGMAYLVYVSAGNNPRGFVRKDASIVAAIRIYLGAEVDWESGLLKINGMDSNLYEGRGGRCVREDAQKIQELVAEANNHKGQAGPWDKASKIWYSPIGNMQNIVEVMATGGISLVKKSTNEAVSNNNANYSLAGAIFTIYQDEACTKQAAQITTDRQGRGSVEGLVQGSYWIKETKAPLGFALNSSVRKVEVNAGSMTSYEASDVPQINPIDIVLKKVDAESGEPSARGAAALSGAQFELKFYAGTYDASNLPTDAAKTWQVTTDKNGTARLVNATGDALYKDSAGNVGLPLGTLVITEVKAPVGYVKNTTPTVVHITSQGSAETVRTYQVPTIKDQVMRGDLGFVKIAGETQARLGNVAFLITSKTTGESHVVVSDANGLVDTSAENIPHTRDTNALDAAYKDGVVDSSKLTRTGGVWFSGSKDKPSTASDRLGALPYDTYLVQELRCDVNKGLKLARFEIVVDRDKQQVNGGTLTDAQGPRIETRATDESGEKLVAAHEQAVVIDTVSYENLTPGTRYTLHADLMDKETGKALTDTAGKSVSAELSFVARLSTGEQKVRLTFDAQELAGHQLVVFEQLLEDGQVVASHADIADDAQTVYIPQIKTEARAEDGVSQDVAATKEVTINDTVHFENLIPHQSYTVTGTLMDKDTGQPAESPQGKITATCDFTPENSSGEVSVTFKFDGSLLVGKTVVAFESLTREGKEYAVHADIDDDAQTIWFPKVSTSAQDGLDGDKNLSPEDHQSIVDTVTYENVIPHEHYVLKGQLVDSQTNEVLDEKQIDVAPEKSQGSVDVMFEVDARELAGRRLVCTEALCRDGRLVAEHADLDDERQSVMVDEPKPPRKEEQPLLPSTGDYPLHYSVAAISSLSLAGAAALRKKRHHS
ncbi:MAG: VaFE repeat-containing surface-anchored protein [Atopobiaceae bacterium]